MSTHHAGLAPVQLLVLSRLLPPGDKGATTAQVRKDLESLLLHCLSSSSLADLLDRTVDDLARARLLIRARKGKTDSCALTDAGRALALETLGLEALPPKTTWGQLLSKYLAARALGLPAPVGPASKPFGGDAGFKAAALRARYRLPIGPFPTLSQATDALLWKLLGREAGGRFDLKSVKEYLLARALGEPEPAAEKAAIQRLIARDLGPRNSKPAELRAAAIRRWLEEPASSDEPERGSTSTGDNHPPTGSNDTPAPAMTLADFARRVASAARVCPTGRFGDNKVFIAHVWDALRDDPDFGGMGLDSFKSRLAEANQARLLDLGHADLVQAMDPRDIVASETAYLGARYHFVRF